MSARKKRPKAKANSAAKRHIEAVIDEEYHEEIQPKRDLTPLEARTQSQGQYIAAIQSSQLIFGIGPAGTGKTYIASVLAADALAEHRVKRLIVTRPALEAGESLGYLPGTLNEKFDPYFWPVREVLNRRLGTTFVDYLIKRKQVEVMPLAYMRGVTFRECFVIFDEAQNATPFQMKMFLTRIGEHSKVVVNGDLRQSDLVGQNGLSEASRLLYGVKGVRAVEFTREDIVRSGLTARIVEAYEG